MNIKRFLRTFSISILVIVIVILIHQLLPLEVYNSIIKGNFKGKLITISIRNDPFMVFLYFSLLAAFIAIIDSFLRKDS